MIAVTVAFILGSLLTSAVFVVGMVYRNNSKEWRVSTRPPEVPTRFRQRTVESDKPTAYVTTARIRPVRRHGRYH